MLRESIKGRGTLRERLHLRRRLLGLTRKGELEDSMTCSLGLIYLSS
jgi:hypothetical protein